MNLPGHHKIIVLGAGASKPAGVPLVNEFLLEGMQEAFSGQWEELEPLNTFWRKTRGSDLYPPPSIEGGIPYHAISASNARAVQATDIEQVLEQAESLTEDGQLHRSVPEGIKQFIFRVIASRSNISRHGARAYDALIDRDIRPHAGPLTIISFNYDTVLERFLLPKELTSRFSYRLQDPLRENFGSYEHDYDGTFDYLKLHGSLNWLRCPSCGQFSVRWAGTYRDEFELGKCLKCGTRRQRVLIAPGKGKEGQLESVRSIWALAETALARADELLVIGYSFRPADKAACALFSENLGVATRSAFKLAVIDRQPSRVLTRLSDLGISKDVIRKSRAVPGFEEYVNSQPTSNVHSP